MTRILIGALAITVIFAVQMVVYDRLGALARRLVLRLRWTRRRSVAEMTGVVRLGLAGLTLATVCLLLALLTGAGTADLGFTGLHPIRIVYGVFLGLGELGLGSLLGHLAIRVSVALAPGGPTDMGDWLTVARGGWMSFYLKTIEVAPLPVALALIVLYVGSEEVLFRGVLFHHFLPLGPAGAVAASTAVFAAVQAIHMPSWRAAMFPCIGALMMGAVHGALFQATGDIAPLVVAHAVFFLAAVL